MIEATSTFHPAHPNALGSYLLHFCLYTLGAVGLLYLAYFYLKKAPALLLGQSKTAQPQDLCIESTLPMDARKQLLVVRSGEERFLLSSTVDGIQLLTRLASAPTALDEPCDISEPQASLEPETVSKASKPNASLLRQPVPFIQYLLQKR